MVKGEIPLPPRPLPSLEASPYRARASRGEAARKFVEHSLMATRTSMRSLLARIVQALLDGSLAPFTAAAGAAGSDVERGRSSWVEINTQTADRLGVRQGDWVKSLRGRERSGFRRFHRRELLRTSWRCPPAKVTKLYAVCHGRGANPISLLSPIVESEPAPWRGQQTRVKDHGERQTQNGSLVLFADRCGSIPPEKPHR